MHGEACCWTMNPALRAAAGDWRRYRWSKATMVFLCFRSEEIKKHWSNYDFILFFSLPSMIFLKLGSMYFFISLPSSTFPKKCAQFFLSLSLTFPKNGPKFLFLNVFFRPPSSDVRFFLNLKQRKNPSYFFISLPSSTFPKKCAQFFLSLSLTFPKNGPKFLFLNVFFRPPSSDVRFFLNLKQRKNPCGLSALQQATREI